MTAKWKGGGNGSRIAIPARIPLIVYPVIQSSITMRCQLVLLIALCAAAFAIQPAAAVDFTVVHINDNHARFEPADAGFGSSCDGEDAVACFGGFARQATAIADAAAAADAAGQDSLILHAGDQYAGTVWDVVYGSNGVQIAPDFLEQIGVQAMTLGNHEFDDGPESLATFIGNASFPVLSCNLDTSAEPLLDGLVQRYTVIELPISGVKVGVVGLTTIDTPEASSPGPNLKFMPYADTLPGCIADAKADGAEFIVALTHIGFSADKELAASAAAADIDLIVGGHSHSLLYGDPPPVGEEQVGSPIPPILVEPPTNETTEVSGPYPTLVAAEGGDKTIPIVTAMWASRYLGVLNVSWTPAEGLLSAVGAPVLLGGANSTNPVAEDRAIAADLTALRGPIDDLSTAVVGEAAVTLDGERADVRAQETNLADLICDAMLWHVSTRTDLLRSYAPAAGRAVCVYNGGGIRASVEAGNITSGDLTTVLPFGNFLVVKAVTGSAMQTALNSGLSGWTGDDDAEGRFPQVGGMRYAFDPSLPEDARLVAAELLLSDNSSAPLSDYEDQPILLVTNNFVAEGGDSYDAFAPAATVYDASLPVVQVLTSYVTAYSPIDVAVDGRIANCNVTDSALLCMAAGGMEEADGMAPAPESAPSSAATPAWTRGLVWPLAAAVFAAAVL